MRQARRTLGVLHAGAISQTSSPGDIATYQWRTRTVKRTVAPVAGRSPKSPDWSTGKPDFDDLKIGINAPLFDDFDRDAVPVTVIDGKNLW